MASSKVDALEVGTLTILEGDEKKSFDCYFDI
jgi:hypothetical protein